MRFAPISRRWLAAAVILAPAALVLAGWPATTAHAADAPVFSVPDDDGYGIADCFAPGSACGKGVADGWCAAHGFVRAISFGAGDVTGSTAAVRAERSPAAGAITIRCGD